MKLKNKNNLSTINKDSLKDRKLKAIKQYEKLFKKIFSILIDILGEEKGKLV
jgi:hypothetical protein